jgi:hypothetical protein
MKIKFIVIYREEENMVRKKYLLVLVLVVALAVGAFLAGDSFAWKAVKPVMSPDGKKVASWQEVQIPDNRVPLGVSDSKDAVGVFGYPDEKMGYMLTPAEAGVDTTKPLSYLSVKPLPGDELPTSGPWNARCYVEYQTSFLGMEIKPMKDYAGDFQFDLIDKEGRMRTRKVYQFRKGFYGEGGIRYKNMVYFYEPPDLRGMSILVWKPVDERVADDNWIYLPALRRVRRIAAAQKMDAFGGTDMTNDQIDRAPGMWDMKITGEKVLNWDQPPLNKCYGAERHRTLIDGRNYVVVEMTPRNKDWPVSKEICYYEKNYGYWVYEESYDKGGKLMKILLPYMAHMYPKQLVYCTYGDWYAHDLRTNHKSMMYLPEIDKAGNKVLDYAKRDWSNYVFWFDTGYSDDYVSQKFMMTGTR